MTAIRTRSGRLLDFAAPSPRGFSLEDVAWGLARQARFAGQTPRFYSVAQHSVLVSFLAPPEFALEGLLHDASEAFMGDLPTPLKSLCPDFKAIEARMEAAIAERWLLTFPWPAAVHRADMVALATERRDLFAANHPMRAGEWDSLVGIEPDARRIDDCWPEGLAGHRFLNRFAALIDLRDEADIPVEAG